MSVYVNKDCPVCGGVVSVDFDYAERCEGCGYTIPSPNWITTSTSTLVDLCPRCRTPLILSMSSGWKECPKCHYGHMDYIGDPPQDIGELYIKSDGVSTAWGRFDPNLMPYTLQIETNLIRLKHKEMELEFELEPDKLEKIDTIILNGYKYVKEK